MAVQVAANRSNTALFLAAKIRSTAITAARVDTVAEHAVHPVGCPSSLDRRRISGPSLRVRNESAALPL